MPGVLENLPTTEGQGITVPYMEWQDSPQVRMEVDQTVGVRTYRVDWHDRLQFMREMVGFSRFAGGEIRRWLPYPDPEMTDIDGGKWLYATKVLSCTPIPGEAFTQNPAFGALGGPLTIPVNQYTYALVTVQFESLPYDVKLRADVTWEYQRFTRWVEEYDARYVTLERGTMVWDEPFNFTDPAFAAGNANAVGQECGYGIGLVEAQGTIDVTWYDVPALAFDRQRIRDYLGSVNEQYFPDAEEGGYAPETMLLLAYKIRPRKSVIGGKTYEISFRFGHQPLNWNKVRAPDGYVHYIKAKGSSPALRMYKGGPTDPNPVNFREMFEP